MATISVVNWSKTSAAMNGNGRNSASTSSSSSQQQGDSLVDPTWELIDPTPDVHAMFLQFNDRFFDGALAGCEVRWSPRMTTCAGLCCYEGRGGLCSIRLSQPLLSLRPRKDLVETLLRGDFFKHEMIHAFLFVKEKNRDHDGHGPQFQSHMQRINQIAHTNITIYHSFHAEVANFKQHWWRCQGACRERKPFYGWVKRASNRAPGPNDLWWKDHGRTCGGTFVKVKEPEGYENGKKLKKTTKKEAVGSKKPGKGVQPNNGKQPTLMSLFGGTGQVLGANDGAGSTQRPPTTALPVSSPHPVSRPPTKDDIGLKTQQKPFSGIGHVLGTGASVKRPSNSSGRVVTSGPPAAKKPKVEEKTTAPASSIVVPTGDFVLVACPACSGQFFQMDINTHLDLCLSS